MCRFLKLVFLSAVICFSSSLRAEMISDFDAQNGTRTTSGGLRATYLGRLFETKSAPATAFEQITAGVTLGNALNGNVKLYAGFDANPNTLFSGGIPSGVFDTGVTFSTANTLGYEALLVPNFSLNPVVGAGLRDSLAANNGLDFWLVSNNPNSLYDAPAGSTSPFTNGFGVTLITAVPEPSSMALVVLSGGILAGLARRRNLRRKSDPS